MRRRQRRVVSEEIPTTSVSVNWTLIAAVVGTLVFGIPTVIFSLRLLNVLDESQLKVIGGVAGTAVLFVVSTLCWSLVVLVYSKLRSKEDRAEELAELRLLQAIQSGAAPNVAPTYHTGTPMDQAAFAQLLAEQRPTQVPATVIDFEQPVDFS